MAKEIERKFLVCSDAWRDRVSKVIAIRQFYLSIASDRSTRVRISDGASARLTFKFGSNLRERDEYEYPIPLDEARALQAFSIGSVIENVRHHVRFGGYVYEVDVFASDLEGLIVAELETPDPVAINALPEWIGREVTGDQRYSNAVLALSDKSPKTLTALAS
ncbi:MAG: CYTH domain-containing protein [Rhizobiaceae bacterium]|nr:CYTH domain-containing protein [Rhizobiaceae bacterium]